LVLHTERHERRHRFAYAMSGAIVVGMAAPAHYYSARVDQSPWFAVLSVAAVATAGVLLVAIVYGRARWMHVAAGAATLFWAAQILAVIVAPAIGAETVSDRFAFAASNATELVLSFVVWRLTAPAHKTCLAAAQV
jgi:hypothetical protein